MTVVRKIQCTVGTVADFGDGVHTVELESSATIPRFRPGQFLHLALDPYEPGSHWPDSRVFSIAWSSAGRDRLAITYVVKGPFTARMERELVPGRAVWVKLPYGDFVVDPKADAVLFAGGTGVTAFTAFVQTLEATRKSRVLLFYGARTPGLFVYGGLVDACARTVSCFSSTLVCEETDGRLAVAPAWPAIATLHAPVFYLSGPAEMLTSLRRQLLDHDVLEDSIRTDEWE